MVPRRSASSFGIAMRKPLVKVWAVEEIERFKRLITEGYSVSRCSAALNRPSNSIKNQARKLGFVMRGTRAVKAEQRARIADAEKNLPPGSQRFDGSRI
jgi:hypothetical protein